MKLFNLTLSFFIALILVACTKDVGPNPDLAAKTECDSITFSKHIKPIIDTNCVYCHNGSGPGPSDFSNFNDLKGYADGGRIKARVIDQLPTRMPEAPATPLTTEQISMIKCWLEAGAPNN
jgi:uncharacterized membrane protein